MNVLDVIRQTTRRVGGGRTRRRGTEEFERSKREWRTVEKLERVMCRLGRLGMHREVLTMASGMARGDGFVGFNPLEAIIGRSQLISSFFLSLGAERARAVGRLVAHNGTGFGTGFLISPRLLMTNNHVIQRRGIAERCHVEFDYVQRFDDLVGATQVFRLLPGEFFLTSEPRDGLDLDYTIVAVEAVNARREELAGRGSIPLTVASDELTVAELANIIQHPGGEAQQVALRDNRVVQSLEHFIQYEADTQPGSSGSPVFNDQWQLAALHHSGVPDEVRPGVYRLRDGGEWDTQQSLPHWRQLRMMAKVSWISNEGVRISSIVADARARLGNDAAHRALFEEAVRDEALPLGGGDGNVCREAAGRAEVAPEIATRAAQGSVTLTIPLQITVQLGPDFQLSAPGGLLAPVISSPPPTPAFVGDPAAPQSFDEFDAVTAVERVRKALEGRVEVLEVRDGFLWQDGFMTEERAVVVVLDPSIRHLTGDPYESLDLPREMDGVPVDVTLGGLAAQLRAAERKGARATEAPSPSELFQERVLPTVYVKPEELSLDALSEPMEVICHVSPDEGWPVLDEFLSRTRETLTLGVDDLSAPHVVAKLSKLAERNPEFRFNLITRRPYAGGLNGGRERELDEGQVAESLRELLGDRFRQACFDGSGDRRTFADAYHLKAAVRDGEELWLSSGDMQSSNQPPPEVRPLTAGGHNLRLLRSYNREWHVVVRNEKLARMFEAYLLHDLKTAEADPVPPPALARELFVHAEPLAAHTSFIEEAAAPRYFARRFIRRDDSAPVSVQPLLTPGNYLEHVIPLVRSAQNRLFIQNQSLSLLDPPEENEDEFVELWETVKSRQEAGVDVRMIFRVHLDEDHARAVKDRLVKFGLRPECIRVQHGCHTAGVVVDSGAVLLGSHNWTNRGVKANRAASLIFRHKQIAEYYERIFLFDWETLAREPRPVSIGRSHPKEGEEPSRNRLPIARRRRASELSRPAQRLSQDG